MHDYRELVWQTPIPRSNVVMPSGHLPSVTLICPRCQAWPNEHRALAISTAHRHMHEREPFEHFRHQLRSAKLNGMEAAMNRGRTMIRAISLLFVSLLPLAGCVPDPDPYVAPDFVDPYFVGPGGDFGWHHDRERGLLLHGAFGWHGYGGGFAHASPGHRPGGAMHAGGGMHGGGRHG